MDFSATCCDNHTLMGIDQAMALLLDAATPVAQYEHVVLTAGLGRVLADDVCSALNVPPHDNSAMDGYALRSDDLAANDTLTLIGQSLAGHPFAGMVTQDQCVRIMTGATIPQGADCVIMQERTTAKGDQVSFRSKAKPGNNIRLCAEDIAIGDLVLSRGRKISAADIGLLASLGTERVRVYRRLKVGLFSTGDELKLPGQALGLGDIYESNRFSVAAMLQRMDIEVLDLGIIGDDKDSIRQAFMTANAQCDLVVSSGGVSVGDADHTKDILQEQGRIGFWKLAIKPGKPFACGHLSDSFFIGLPGNPVSAMVTFHQLAVPYLRKLAGQTEVHHPRFNATLTAKISKRPGRTDFQRGIYSFEQGVAQVCTTGSQGSGILSSMSRGNCYIVLERDRADVAAGESVTVELFDALIGSY